jgi:hypothetical protein
MKNFDTYLFAVAAISDILHGEFDNMTPGIHAYTKGGRPRGTTHEVTWGPDHDVRLSYDAIKGTVWALVEDDPYHHDRFELVRAYLDEQGLNWSNC